MNLDTVVGESIGIATSFRRNCLRNGYMEESRVNLKTDPSETIRFKNSSISVLAGFCAYELTPKRFLFQPALRLRNQAQVNKSGKMSPFGCYFVSFGTIAPPNMLHEAFASFVGFFLDDLGIPAGRLVLRGTEQDADLLSLLRTSRVPIELDGCEPRLFRHTFGLEGVTGRNINMAIVSHGALSDVANLILMERDGRPWAIESAFGINNIVTRLHQLEHPVLATPGVALTDHGFDGLIEMDALSSANALAIDGFVPRARGREGNYRTFVKLLVGLWKKDRDGTEQAIRESLAAEIAIRTRVSPLEEGLLERTLEDASHHLLSHVERLAHERAPE